jgi:hypothetical protein
MHFRLKQQIAPTLDKDIIVKKKTHYLYLMDPSWPANRLGCHAADKILCQRRRPVPIEVPRSPALVTAQLSGLVVS